MAQAVFDLPRAKEAEVDGLVPGECDVTSRCVLMSLRPPPAQISGHRYYILHVSSHIVLILAEYHYPHYDAS